MESRQVIGSVASWAAVREEGTGVQRWGGGTEGVGSGG